LIQTAPAIPAVKLYTRAYLRHLFKAKEILGLRLITWHNLHFLLQLMEGMRKAIQEDRLAAYCSDFYQRYYGTPLEWSPHADRG
jgi:queuine tRNA-ribosyltransferase